MSNHEHQGVGIYIFIFLALLGLTALTVYASFVNLGSLNVPVALGIAVLKATLVVLFFMHVLHSPNLIKLFVVSGFLWLIILFVFTLNDYLTRGWHPPQEPGSWITQSPAQFTTSAAHSSEAH